MKKIHGMFNNNIVGDLMPVYNCDQQRHDIISEWALNVVWDADVVFIEDYSYASTGRVFHIAENTGLLKHKLWQQQRDVHTIPPTVIKKFATTKGNASKAFLEEVFVEQTGIDLRTDMNLTPKQSNPISDIIDAYFICKYGVDLLNKSSDSES
jgi:Holliday junction resolvasome RuvABC endonuclease subunit